MDRGFGAIHLLILWSGLCFVQVARGSSVLFLDASDSKYIRSRSEIGEEVISVSPLEVAAAASVLLGVAPPVSLKSESSTKLDRILSPNPFNKPHAVVILEVQGVKDTPLNLDSTIADDGTLTSKIAESGNAHIEISGDDDVNQISINELIGHDSAGNDGDFQNLATWMGGSYMGSMESHDGFLELPLPSGSRLKLYMSKTEDRMFTLSLISLFDGVEMTLSMQEDFGGSNRRPIDLLTCYFTGIKSLGTAEVSSQHLELFYVALNKLLDALRKAYKGELVGIILLNEREDAVGPTVGVKKVQGSFRSDRWLEEVVSPNSTGVAEVMLVRTTLAWVTGVILLLSALIGVYFLLYMPFTRDTLLYSNVKLD